MKKFVLFLFLGTIDGYAQNPYIGITTVTADGITFEVEASTYTFSLSNIANIYDDVPLYYKDGRKLTTEEEYAGIGAKKIDPNSTYRALREVFDDDTIKALRKERYSPMTIFYVVGSDGETLEVAFIMRALPILVSLPPETFAVLEKKLKQYVRWEPNEFAKGLRYFHLSGFTDFNKVPLCGELYSDPVILPAPDKRLPLEKKER